MTLKFCNNCGNSSMFGYKFVYSSKRVKALGFNDLCTICAEKLLQIKTTNEILHR